MKNSYFQFKKIGIFTPTIQIVLLVALFVATSLLANLSYRETGLVFNNPLFTYASVLFAPVYEEMIFRGLIFSAFLKNSATIKALIYSSILFGLWHIKNIFFMDTSHLASQIVYAGFVFGPLMCYITYKTKTIWIASIVHYANNFVVFLLLTNGLDWGFSALKQMFSLIK
jgi:membrane protease YdiL (CAAX protease family)